MNTFRNTLQSGGTLIGSWVNTCSTVVAELMAAAGFDFLTIDAEHSAVGLPQIQMLLQAIRSGNPQCAGLVRMAGNEYALTKQYLDAGAMGVIAPLINTAEQARQLVAAAKYPPQGRRGVGFCRANKYGLNLKENVVSANDQVLVCVQIEHVDGLRNIDEILSVPGVDAVFVGPYDLSASMGITAQFDHPDMIGAVGDILAACKKHNIAPGIHVVQPDTKEVLQRCSEGYRFIAYSLDITMLSNACCEGLAELKEKTSQA